MSKLLSSSVACIRAWRDLLSIVGNLQSAGCDSISVSSLRDFMIRLIERGNKGKRFENGLSVRNEIVEVVVGDCVAYANHSGRLIGYGNLKEVNAAELKKDSSRVTLKNLNIGGEDIG